MKHALYHAVAHAIIYAASLCYAAPPTLNITASKATKAGGTSITVNRDERVTIQVAAEVGSTIAVVTFPEFSYIAPSNKSELTWYAKESCRVVIVAFKAGEASQQKIDVVVSGTPVPPGPGPGPTPPDPPTPFPVPTSVVGKAIYDAAAACKSPTKVKDCQAMVAGLLKYRPQLAASTFKSSVKEVDGKFEIVVGGVKKSYATKAEASSQEIIGNMLLHMLNELSDDAKKSWGGLTGPLITKYAMPLSQAVKDKATGLQAIDDTIAGLKAVR